MARAGMDSQEAETLLKHMEETIHLLEEMGGVQKRLLSRPATSLPHAEPMSKRASHDTPSWPVPGAIA